MNAVDISFEGDQGHKVAVFNRAKVDHSREDEDEKPTDRAAKVENP